MRLAGNGQNGRSDGESRGGAGIEIHHPLLSAHCREPPHQCLPALEPALIGVFICHSSNFFSETQ
jgi:hypothetical protein